MPLYDYDCAACGRRFEVIHGVHADPPAACPLCGSGPVRKAISGPDRPFQGLGLGQEGAARDGALQAVAPSRRVGGSTAPTGRRRPRCRSHAAANEPTTSSDDGGSDASEDRRSRPTRRRRRAAD